MYFQITSALKRRLIRELKESFGRHPKYNKLTNWIKDRYSYTDVPQFGIIIKNASASKMQLSPDNFQGNVSSYIKLAGVAEFPNTSLEWAQEDQIALNTNRGVFPSPPGIYYIVVTSPTTFEVDPLLSATNELVLEAENSTTTTAYLRNAPIFPKFIQLFNGGFLMRPNIDYTIDVATGIITFLIPPPQNSIVRANYFYPTKSRGPFQIVPNYFNNEAIPGAILAFGNRVPQVAPAGQNFPQPIFDKQAVIISGQRDETALEFGGHWECSFNFDCIARDPMQLEEIADFTLMTLWGEKKNQLELEGIVITDISHGGEAEEEYDSVTGDLWYTSSMSISFMSDWIVLVPLPFSISRISTVSASSADISKMTDQQIANLQSSLQLVPSLAPYIVPPRGKYDFERIS